MNGYTLKASDKYHLGHYFKDCMLQNPDVVMQIDAATGEEETRRSVLTRSINLARCLRRLGLQPGNVLVLGGNNHLDLCIPYYAALLNGYPIAGVDPFFKFGEIKELFKLVSPKIAFCQRASLSDYHRAVEELGLDTRLVTFDGVGNTMAELMDSCDISGTVEDFEIAKFDTDKVYAWLVSTSGSMGLPKVAALKHQPILDVVKYVTSLRIKKNHEEETSTLPAPKPALNLSAVQWVSAFLSVLSIPTMNQIKVQTSAPATVEHVIDIINKYRPITTATTPSILCRILKHEKPCDLSCFNTVFLVGATIYRSFLLDLKAALRPDALVIEAYGQTECLGMALYPAPHGPLGNCGKEMPMVAVKLVDPVSGETVTEPNVPGELWTKGPSFSEYYNNQEETAKAFSEDGWYKTGDLLRRDENGFYYFVERLKMLIKFRSYHVVPMELEEVILKHEGVHDVCVISIPNQVDGEWPVAVVARTAGATVTAQEIKDIVANTLSEHKQLRGGVLFVDDLPMTSTGKIARGKVRQLVKNAALE